MKNGAMAQYLRAQLNTKPYHSPRRRSSPEKKVCFFLFVKCYTVLASTRSLDIYSLHYN